jgi:hypothetical protein
VTWRIRSQPAGFDESFQAVTGHVVAQSERHENGQIVVGDQTVMFGSQPTASQRAAIIGHVPVPVGNDGVDERRVEGMFERGHQKRSFQDVLSKSHS